MAKMQKRKKTENNSKDNLNTIVEKVHRRVDFAKSHVKETVTELLEVIQEQLSRGKSIVFAGYFSFYTRKQAPREMIMKFGKNKGKKIKIPTKTVPALKFSATLKKKIAK
jgi:nucleoid DNA-binding protein